MYLEINCLCLVILLIIFLNIRRHINKYLLDQKLFLFLIFMNALILVCDSFMWLLDGMQVLADTKFIFDHNSNLLRIEPIYMCFMVFLH